MNWQIRIQDPSGETRVISLFGSLSGSITLGREPQSDIPMRDPTLSGQAHLVLNGSPSSPSPYWLRLSEGSAPIQLGDLWVREAILPPGMPFRWGETRLTIERELPDSGGEPQPAQPSHVRHWLSCSYQGIRTLWITKKAAATPLSLYLAGETGVGKEVLAHLAHAWSERASGPFVPLHCAALPLGLVESELFGHVRGAFTGALNHRPGALMQAHGGTLFLDEIGDLPMDIQIKLLRFLENGEIRPVGADRTSRADARLICATHRPLLKLVEEGKFRRDLYYRLASVTVDIPALRERPEDIDLLAIRFAAELRRGITPQAILRLQAHTWPGNVRELRHAVERASGLAGPFKTTLDEECFEFLLTPQNVAEAPALELNSAVLSLNEMERHMILKALRIAQGNRSQAARILGVARSTLFEMLRRHKIQGPRAYAGALEGRPTEAWKAAEPVS